MNDHPDSHHDHEHGSELSEAALRVRALETILTEKGYIDPAALDVIIETYETKIGPRNGALVVARAWRDADFKARLMADATAAATANHANPLCQTAVITKNLAKNPAVGGTPASDNKASDMTTLNHGWRCHSPVKSAMLISLPSLASSNITTATVAKLVMV